MGSRGCGCGWTYGCLVVVGEYAFLISLAFVIVTAMYGTTQECEEVVAQNAEVKTIMHVDI